MRGNCIHKFLAWTLVSLIIPMLALPCGAAAAAEPPPLAYVANLGDNTVSVIDTATNKVAATVRLANMPSSIAVSPDGSRIYVPNYDPADATARNRVSVINAATNKIVATISLGLVVPSGIAISPDGRYAYVVSGLFGDFYAGSFVTIDTATNKVSTYFHGNESVFLNMIAVSPDGKRFYVTADQAREMPGVLLVYGDRGGRVEVGGHPQGVAVAADGKHVYVTNDGRVQVVNTTFDSIVATIQGVGGSGIAVTPDSKRAYVADGSVISTATNRVVATVPVGGPSGIAVTPDGKRVYVANSIDNTVSVVDTATNRVIATVPVGAGPIAVAIMPPPHGVLFSTFHAEVAIQFGSTPRHDSFELESSFTLGQASNGINPVAEPVSFQVGEFRTTIPPGSFKGQGKGPFAFWGVVNGVTLSVLIAPTGVNRYAASVSARNANLAGTDVNTVPVTVSIGDDRRTLSVTARVVHNLLTRQ